MLKTILLSALLLGGYCHSGSSGLKFLSDNEGYAPQNYTNLTGFHKFENLVLNRGYRVESHYVVTDDKYILKIFRIPSRLNQTTPNKGKVALLWHGIVDSADCWVIADRNLSIPFQLVDEGFDVWLGNSRGNKHSRRHVHLDPDKDTSFWDFTFEEMGKYDVPATLEHIYRDTQVEKITFIGHSQGTSQIFSGMSENITYYKQRLNGFVALGPVTNLKYSTSFLIQFAIKLHLDDLAIWFGFNELLRGPEYTDPFIGYFCKFLTSVCKGIISLIADSEPNDDNPELFVHYTAHFPSGCSTKSLAHYAQINRRGEFVKYDYGYNGNYARYGQPTPPAYNVDNIKDVPVCFLYGIDDHLSNEKDNRLIKEKLEKNGDMHFYKIYEKMGHLTYFIPRDTIALNDTLKCVRDFNSK